MDSSDPAYMDSLNWQDLDYPPTSVGGIHDSCVAVVCRLDLKEPPTAVGGIRLLSQSLETFRLEQSNQWAQGQAGMPVPLSETFKLEQSN